MTGSLKKKRVVVLSGAGMSAESGLKTFRGNDGLWEGHRVEDVATPDAWERDPSTVLRFYNERRRQLRVVHPNPGHRALVELEKRFAVEIVTQNVDDLHERAGSTRVLHLHGQLTHARSMGPSAKVIFLEGRDIKLGDLAEDGFQLRPHVVWFGESVPAMEEVEPIVRSADILLVVGTSLAVYPAASLVHLVSGNCRRVWINTDAPESLSGFECIAETAAQALPWFVSQLMNSE